MIAAWLPQKEPKLQGGDGFADAFSGDRCSTVAMRGGVINDPFNLQRFVDAQANGVYEQALAEIRAGRKESHWMWFIFPQSADLGRSATAKFYGLSGAEEARAYLAHPVLGPRYRESVAAVRAQVEAGGSLEAIFGELDAMKFRSSVEILRI